MIISLGFPKVRSGKYAIQNNADGIVFGTIERIGKDWTVVIRNNNDMYGLDGYEGDTLTEMKGFVNEVVNNL